MQKTLKLNLKLFSQGVILSGLLSACASTPMPTKQTNKYTSSKVPTYYTVKYGDTLSHIATRFGLDYRKVAMMNGLDSNYTIYAGQKLRLLNSTPNMPLIPQRVTEQQLPKIIPTTNVPTYQSYHKQNLNGQWQLPLQGQIIRAFNPKAGYQGAGIWLSAAMGTPVLASQSGVVVYAGNQLPEFGKMVLIVHQNKMLTAYTHLGSVNVHNNQAVKQGQMIGTVGFVNLVNQSALQFQLRNHGVPINPSLYLKN